MLLDVHSEIIFSEGLPASTGGTGAGTALDLTGCVGGTGVVICNSSATGFVFKITESATSGGTYTDCTTTDYPNDIVSVTGINGNSYLKFDCDRALSFIKVHATQSGSGKCSAVYGVPGGHTAPVTQGT